jgi:hypothetical protein
MTSIQLHKQWALTSQSHVGFDWFIYWFGPSLRRSPWWLALIYKSNKKCLLIKFNLYVNTFWNMYIEGISEEQNCLGTQSQGRPS